MFRKESNQTKKKKLIIVIIVNVKNETKGKD